jgi:prevent-host-death family protein
MTVMLNVRQARTQFSQLLDRVQCGEEIIITKAGRPIARLAPISMPVEPRKPGSAKGIITLSADFDAPLPDSVLDGFEGR